ncbi:MAG: hypothetical protein Hals2KO_19330 [Halioglobus sp.]
MNVRLLVTMVCAFVLLQTVRAFAESEALQSDWLELVRGYKGSVLGAELVSIEQDSTPEMQRVTVAIPKSAMPSRETIEEVLVVGRKPEQPEPIEFTYEWLDDYENDRYGLVIHLRKDNKWPIRLYLHADPAVIKSASGN